MPRFQRNKLASVSVLRLSRSSHQSSFGWRLSASATTVAFVLLVCAVLIGHEAFLIWTSRDAALQDERKDTENLARSLAQHAEDTIRTVDAILISMVERMEVGSRDGSAIERLRRLFREEAARLPQVKNLIIVDENGIALVDKLPTTDRVSVADREYFQHHRSHQDRIAHVSKPVRGKMMGDWVVPITRRINNPDGTFAGVAMATVSVNYFQEFYERFDIGAGGAILLASMDGILLVRHPFSDAAMGRDLSQGGIFRELLPQGPHGSGEIRSSTDGVVRLNSYRRLDTYPLVLAVAEEKDEILAPWRDRAKIGALRAIAMSGIIALLGFVLWRRTRKIAEQGALLKATLDNMNQGLIVVDENDTLPICNRRALELLDLPAALMAARPSTGDVIAYQAARGEFDAAPAEILGRLRPHTHDETENVYERTRPDGTVLEVRTVPFPAGGVVRTYTDITERKRIEAELRQSEQQYRLLADNTSDLVARLSLDFRYGYVSPASRELLGYDPDELIGRHAGDLVHPADRAQWLQSLIDAPRARRNVSQSTYRVLKKDGSFAWIEENRRKLLASDGFVLSMRDVSRRKDAELRLEEANQRLEVLARQDALTGLANRRHFDEMLAAEFRRAAREKTSLGLIMIDADHFKRFNDIYGHPVGDSCLRSIALALQQGLNRPADFVARYGGEEFAALVPNTTQSGAFELAERLREAVHGLRIAHEASPRKIVTISLGVASVTPSDDEYSAEDLVTAADTALYAAKKAGRDQTCLAGPSAARRESRSA
jgi:diguanylate cyclase (GGDEF)-like protein/PAS domain S-box-containing protein